MVGMSQIPRVGILFRPQLPPERLAGFVAAAEDAGLDDLWLWEDCFLEGGLTTATAALAWSSSVRVGLGVMPVPLRNPALAAMEIATVARLFPGRFVPAFGHGVQTWMAQVGAAAASPLGLMREWVTAVRALLAGDTVTVAGRYVTLDRVALDWPPPAPVPVLIGGRGPKTLALAGELADGLVLDAGTAPDTVRRALAAAAHPAEIVVYLPCGTGPGSIERIQGELPPGAPPAVAAGLAAVGSAAAVAGTIRAFAASGATTVVLQPAGDDPDVAAVIRLAGAARARLRAG
jgi:alkanesulfonate monooxygenase SsuD/methylene tetrahydromethanopterin reductase-like flavin-dependent oxidoreductase (luciferase family)